MGLAEQIKAGGNLTRNVVGFATDTSGIGSASLGASYAILNIQTSLPCRLRLYDDQSSRDSLTEASRSFGNTDILSSVSLIGDFSMSAPGNYTIDPTLYAVVKNFTSPFTHYRVDPPIATTIGISNYVIEDSNLLPDIGTAYSISNRRTIKPISAYLSGSESKVGVFSDLQTPQTFLLVSASLSNINDIVRLRLYSTSGSLYDSGEIQRTFQTEPPPESHIIVDAIISGSSELYFSPKIVGANLTNMGDNILLIRGNSSLISGEPEIYFIVQNMRGVTSSVTASLHVYALED